MDFMAGHSIPLEARMLLNMLKGAAAQQANQGRSILLSNNICHTIVNYLERQAAQTESLQDDIRQKQQAMEQLRAQAEAELQDRQRTISELQAQVAHLQAAAANLHEQMRAKQYIWDRQKYDLETQLADVQLRFRRKMAARSLPNQELAQQVKYLETDNRRLVALLYQVPKFRALAAEVWTDGNVHYLPLEEWLEERGVVEDVYMPLVDRPVAAPGALGADDPAAPPGGTQVVLDEQFHWVPREALQAGTALMRRLMPTLPTSQLMALVAELNKVWRDREHKRLAEMAAAYQQEVQRLRETFEESREMKSDALVPVRGSVDLKQRMAQAAIARAEALTAAKGEKRRIGDAVMAAPPTSSRNDVPEAGGLTNIQELSRRVNRLEGRNKKLAAKLARQARALMGSAGEPLCRCQMNRMLASVPVRALLNDSLQHTPDGSSEPAPETTPALAVTATANDSTSPPAEADVAMSPAGDESPIHVPEVSFGGFLEDASDVSGSVDSHHSAPTETCTQPHPDPQTQAWSADVCMAPDAPQDVLATEKAAPAAAHSNDGAPCGVLQTLPQQPGAVGAALVRVNVLPTLGVSSLPHPDEPEPSKTAAVPSSASFADRLSATLSGLSIRSSWDAGAGASGSGGGGGRAVMPTFSHAEKEKRAASLSEWLRRLPPRPNGRGPSNGANVNRAEQVASASSLCREVTTSSGGGGAAGPSAGHGQQPAAPVRVSVRFPQQDVAAV